MPQKVVKSLDQYDVLLVEDEENDVLLMKHAIASVGRNVLLHVASDGQQAMHYLSGENGFTDRDKYPIPSLVILDLKLPRKSGIEVLRWVRQDSDLKRLPIIVFTSSLRPEDLEMALSSGANSFVVKPTSVEKRNQVVGFMLDYWEKHNQPSTALERKADKLK